VAWDSDKTVGGAQTTGAEWNTMVGVIKSPLVTASVTATSTELNYSSGVTSAIQTQLNNIKSWITPSTTGTYVGITGTLTSGEATAFGDLLYLKSDGYLWKSSATVASTADGLIMMSVGTTTSSASNTYLFTGLLANSAWAFTKGDKIYMNTTSGGLVSSLITGSGKIIRIVGHALASSIIHFNPDNTYVELT
jgi:hypothetical protein